MSWVETLKKKKEKKPPLHFLCTPWHTVACTSNTLHSVQQIPSATTRLLEIKCDNCSDILRRATVVWVLMCERMWFNCSSGISCWTVCWMTAFLYTSTERQRYILNERSVTNWTLHQLGICESFAISQVIIHSCWTRRWWHLRQEMTAACLKGKIPGSWISLFQPEKEQICEIIRCGVW